MVAEAAFLRKIYFAVIGFFLTEGNSDHLSL
jgi:hypothetical protein